MKLRYKMALALYLMNGAVVTVPLGQEVKVIAPDMTYFGTAEDIDEEGLLIVRREDGSKGCSR